MIRAFIFSFGPAIINERKQKTDFISGFGLRTINTAKENSEKERK